MCRQILHISSSNQSSREQFKSWRSRLASLVLLWCVRNAGASWGRYDSFLCCKVFPWTGYHMVPFWTGLHMVQFWTGLYSRSFRLQVGWVVTPNLCIHFGRFSGVLLDWWFSSLNQVLSVAPVGGAGRLNFIGFFVEPSGHFSLVPWFLAKDKRLHLNSATCLQYRQVTGRAIIVLCFLHLV